MKTSIRRLSANIFTFIFIIFSTAAGALAQEESCIKAWVNGQQLYGITSTNPITYSEDYCIDSDNAIGYVNYNTYPPEDPVVDFTSDVDIDTVNDFWVSENDCQFYYEYPDDSNWGGFSGLNAGTIYFYFATNSSTMAYGTGMAYFRITDDNASTAVVGAGHLCYPGSWLANSECSSRFSLLPARATINLYDKKDAGRVSVLPLY